MSTQSGDHHPLGSGCWGSGLGFGQRVANGLAFMGCTMHFRGWPPCVGGCHPYRLAWHPCWVSMAPCMPLLFCSFHVFSFQGFVLSQGVCYPTATRLAQMSVPL